MSSGIGWFFTTGIGGLFSVCVDNAGESITDNDVKTGIKLAEQHISGSNGH